MSRHIHMCISVRGLLHKHTDDFRRICESVTNDGKSVTPHEYREYLMDQLAAGREVLPFGEPCEGFDYKTGCPGHDVILLTTREGGT